MTVAEMTFEMDLTSTYLKDASQYISCWFYSLSRKFPHTGMENLFVKIVTGTGSAGIPGLERGSSVSTARKRSNLQY